ncbi:sigma-70 family RNA polymerase sigma factor [Tundrisphaera lichenicola]|uniref:sigma-70 family RNA polymerase sigma factor n=1 Tax=Tundrisphaera lichenicola TaxID=2029860 RepID=UPI003EBDA4A4
MASGHSGDAIRQINRLFEGGTVVGLTDGELLDRFATHRGEGAELAFQALVIRHGSMVLRVARGMLRDPHDVEDAFQATFLVLVRRAGSIGEREQIGPWLYGVALRVSKKARTLAARRSKREGGIVDDPPGVEADAAWLDTRPILHEELGRLPDKYRKPVVLCHLQGLTHAEAAQELAWPVGTVSVRLARARKLLRERLTRRGLTATGALWGAGLATEGASASVPQALLQSTLKAAMAYATGKTLAAGAVSAGAMMLTRGVLMMMFLSKLKWVAVPMLVGVGTVGAVVVAQGTPSGPVADRPPRRAVEKSADLPPIPVREQGRSPFELAPEPVATRRPPLAVQEGETNRSQPDRDRTFDNGLPIPPDYFDLNSPANKGGAGSPLPPPTVKQGQRLVVEVLEALPGRPITGERIVGPDGTISLTFYGDLYVEGLTRTQIKVKLIEHMRKIISDEVLGVITVDANTGEPRIVPAAESKRVFVDDTVDLLDRPARGQDAGAGIEELRDRVEDLEGRLDHVSRELRELRRERSPAEPGDGKQAQP